MDAPEVPEEISRAADLVHNWMASQGFKDWAFKGLASRHAYESMKALALSAQAEHKQTLDCLRNLSTELDVIRNEFNVFRVTVLKITTEATVHHVASRT